jgi:DNA/RNA-binding domain of Phe-tRNA-synthetase-like protein
VPVSAAASEKWSESYPGAMVGLLALHGLVNPDQDPALALAASDLCDAIRSRYAGADRSALRTIPTLRAYSEYFKRFGKTYHVQLQLESVLFKGKAITGASAIVHAMFIAELRNMLLTAAHDLSEVQGELTVNVSVGDERCTLLGGTEQTLKPKDMYIRDEVGVLSSIICGPCQRAHITSETRSVVFTTYAPLGISPDEIDRHLSDLEATVRLFSPEAKVEYRALIRAE